MERHDNDGLVGGTGTGTDLTATSGETGDGGQTGKQMHLLSSFAGVRI